MSSLTCQITMSLDGFAAGPNQSPDDPLGVGGERMHEWAVKTEGWRAAHGLPGGEDNVDSQIAAHAMDGVGAFIMGRKMFGGGRDDGEWDLAWRGWWGDDPPFHKPVYVLTHHPREPLEMDGGTTFYFVTDGIKSALEQARAAADGGNVSIGGGASTVQQYLRAGLLDELHLHIAPVLLGGGERLFQDVGDPKLEPVETVHSPLATHVRYRIAR